MKNTQKNTQQETLQSTIKVFLIISMVVFMGVGSVNASLGTFKINECVQVKTILNSTQANISSISYPNSTIAITEQPMTKVGLTFNYTFCDTAALGTYVYDYYDELGNVYVNDFKITYTGEEVTSQQIFIYIIALIFLILLLFGTSFLINKLPSKDAIDEEGTIMQVSMLKHLRTVLWVFIWVITMVITFIISNLGIAYLNSKMIGDLFFVIYRIQFYVLIIGTPVYLCWIIYKIFKDKEMKRLMERGIEFGGKGL